MSKVFSPKMEQMLVRLWQKGYCASDAELKVNSTKLGQREGVTTRSIAAKFANLTRASY